MRYEILRLSAALPMGVFVAWVTYGSIVRFYSVSGIGMQPRKTIPSSNFDESNLQGE